LVINQTTDLKNQELWDPKGASTTYWEGAVNYAGTMRERAINGVGYLEMTGYAQHIRLSGMAHQK
jgi:predicted secreted hydrolase